MKTCSLYIAEAKRKLGDPRMSDRALGEALGYAQQTVAAGKSGGMSDHLAIGLEKVLRDEVTAGEILLVARAEREKDQVVKERLLAFAKNVFAVLPASAALEARGGMTVATSAVQLSRAAPRSTGWRRRRDSNP